MAPQRRRTARLLRAQVALADGRPTATTDADAPATSLEAVEPWPLPTVMTLPLPEFWELPTDPHEHGLHYPASNR